EPEVGKIVDVIAGPNGKRALIIESELTGDDAQVGALRTSTRRQRGEGHRLAEMSPHQPIVTAGKPSGVLAAATVVADDRRASPVLAVRNRRADAAGVVRDRLGADRVAPESQRERRRIQEQPGD